MMLNKYFVNQGVKLAGIENFIRTKFPSGDYSSIDLQTTPLGIKIVIYTNKPGKIIGRGGRNIDEITETLKKEFDLENPQIDVKEIANPDLDAKIVAKQIRSAIEKGYNYKKIGNLTIKRVMGAGALGAEIIIAGKVSGSKAAMAKFIEGHIKHSGELKRHLVDEGYEEARTKPGTVGIRVRIMVESRDITGRVVKRGTEPLGKKVAVEEEIEEALEEGLEAEEIEEEADKKKDVKPAKSKEASKAGKCATSAKSKPTSEAGKEPEEKKGKPAEKGAKKGKEGKIEKKGTDKKREAKGSEPKKKAKA